jgi:integrase
MLTRLIKATANGPDVQEVPGHVRATVYHLAAFTGLRRNEIGQLRRSDIDLKNGTIRVRARVSKNRKDAL